MQAKTVETLAWVLIYSGLLLAGLGLFVQPLQPPVAWVMMVAGGLAAAAGAGLVIWRSRMPAPTSKEKR
jgi:hypothetical protein